MNFFCRCDQVVGGLVGRAGASDQLQPVFILRPNCLIDDGHDGDDDVDDHADDDCDDGHNDDDGTAHHQAGSVTAKTSGFVNFSPKARKMQSRD